MKTFPSILLGSSLLLATLTGPAGCSLSKPYPSKELYAIDAGRPAAAAAAPSALTLRVLRTRIASPFSTREFHYLMAPNRYQEDYYANFVADPDQLLTGQMIEWLSAAGIYAAVVDGSSSVAANRSLQCVISELYGDLSEAAAPKAVISARFFLLDETGVDAKVLFSRDYREVEPASGPGTDQLTRAWGRAMKKILEGLTTDLRVVR